MMTTTDLQRCPWAGDDPLMRRATVESLEQVDVAARLQLVAPLLRDPVRGVRLAAANTLADVRPVDLADPAFREALELAFDEYVASQRVNADRAEAWVNLAGFHFRQGRIEEAEQAYAEARRRNKRFVPIYVNQADMYRALDREADGERVLREGLAAAPEVAVLHHTLGLLLIRSQRLDEAMQALERAYRLGPENPRLGYVYGIALENAGQRDPAIEVWDAVVKRHPNDRATLNVLTMTLYQAGEHQRLEGSPEGCVHREEGLRRLGQPSLSRRGPVIHAHDPCRPRPPVVQGRRSFAASPFSPAR